MKKVFLLLIVAVMAISLTAQEEVGKGMWLGGTFGFSLGDNGGDDISSYTIGPEWGMMLNDDFGAGVNLIFASEDFGGSKQDVWQVTPFVRYYKGVGDRFKFFADGGFTVGGGDTSSLFQIGVRPGMQYWFNSDWSMAAKLGFLGYTKATLQKDTPNEYDYKNFELDMDMSEINFSLYYHF